MTGKYESHVANRLDVIKGWCRDGLTEEQIAKKLGIGYSTLSKYKKQYVELVEALKEGKEVADYRVENALYEKALGGDTTAMIFWLKNRKSKEWRDKQEIDHSHKMHIKVDVVNDDEYEES